MNESDLKRLGEQWMEKIRQADKREEKWYNEAKDAEAAYLSDDSEVTDGLPHFNILHSNVETIVPAIINSPASPDIRARNSRREDEVADHVATIYERVIASFIDDNALDAEQEKSAQDAFMAGRGIVRLRFDADIEDMVDELGEPVETVANERIEWEVVSWRDYRQGPAKRWKDVPWVAYRHEVSEEERERLENPEYAAKDEERAVDEDLNCTVWEIWCKETKKVYFIVAENATVLDIQDDPLEVDGFFPQGEPVVPIQPTHDMTPVCPYSVYKTLAKELDTATKRINAIMKGLKVRGLIAGDSTAIELMGELGDNELAPVPNIENLAAIGGLERAVMWWPVDQAIAVLRELYQQRESTKQSIYEITGISDIVRGASAASETATAQSIKAQWGSLRIKKMQMLIVRQARDLMRLAADVISRHFTPQTLQEISGLPIMPEMMELIQSPLDNYRIDVETDSTIRADLTKSRGEMSEFLNGTANFFATMAPIVGSAPQAAGPLANMYASFASQFNLGKQAEDALDEFTRMAEEAAESAQQGQAQQAAQVAQEAAIRAQQADMQLKMQEQQIDAQKAQTDAVLDAQKLKLDQDKQMLEAQKAQAEIELRREELVLKRDEMTLKAGDLELKRATMMQNSLVEQLQATLAEMQAQIAAMGQEHTNIAQAQQQLALALQESNETIAKAMSAPREVVRDENGRPVGVRIAPVEGVSEATAGLAAAITAPKKVVRDENGRPVGLRVVGN